MKVSILDVLSLGVSGGVPEGDGDHGDNIRLKANMISFVVTVWSPLSPSGPPRRAARTVTFLILSHPGTPLVTLEMP